MLSKTYTWLIALLFSLFLASSALALPFGSMQRTVVGEQGNAASLACIEGNESVFRRDFVWNAQVRATVSTSACPVVVELLDLRNGLEKSRGNIYQTLTSVSLPAGESAHVSVPGPGFTYFVVFRTSEPSAPSSFTAVAVLWRYAYHAPDPLGAGLGLGLLLVGLGAVFVGILLLTQATGRFEVGVALAALAGFSYAIIGYAFSTASMVDLFLCSAAGSSLLVGLSGYFVTGRYLHGLPADARVAVSLGLYLAVGATALSATSLVAAFQGVPIILIPIWPTGVTFMLFAERVYDRSALVAVFWAVRILVVAAAIGSLVPSYLKAKRPGEIKR